MSNKKKYLNMNKYKRERVITLEKVIAIIIGTAILSFGLHNIHKQTNITEGGALGTILLVNHWFGISPAIISPIVDVICYAFAFKVLGKDFLKVSAVSTVSLAGFFWVWEQFPHMVVDFSASPLIAAISGGLFVGIGVGIVVRSGGSTGGDDALALVISKLTNCRLSVAYFATDITVLLLSLTYISYKRILYSIVTVFISSFLIDFIKDFNFNQFSFNKVG